MADFPSTPVTGQTYTYGGTTYTWNGEKWVISPGANIQKTNVLPYGENIDLSAGSVHKLTTNVGDYISFVNIPPGSSKWTVEIDISDVSKYDLVTSNATGPLREKVLADTTPSQTFFRPDGSQLFGIGATNDMVFSYNLSTPWNISSANTGSVFSVAGFDADPRGIAFDPEGKNMYISGGGVSKTIFQFSLGTAWDITTSVLSKTKVLTGYGSGGPNAIKFKPDGTKMFVVGWPSTNISTLYEYQLNTPWDVSTANQVGTFALSTGAEPLVRGIDISANGRKIFAAGESNDAVFQYSMSTPWQANTAVYNSIVWTQFSPLETVFTNVMFNPDGSRMFVSGTSSDTLREYVTSFSGKNYTGTFTFPSNIKWAGEAAPTISANTECIIDFYTPDGGTTIYGIPKFNRVI